MPKQHANAATMPVEYKWRAFNFQCVFIHLVRMINA